MFAKTRDMLLAGAAPLSVAVMLASSMAADNASATKLVPGQVTKERVAQLLGGANSSLLKHPADWSRDVLPIPVHSHNDYWRDVPILDALALGVRSVESDVWLYKDELYVGHDPFALSQERTFSSLTVQPLLKAIDQANEANALKSDTDESRFFAGLQKEQKLGNFTAGFYSAGVGLTAPIQLLIDIKTDGETTWPRVVEELKPLRDRGYLTRYEAGKVIPGPILVVGTGNTPIDQVAPLTSRDYFFDGPLGNLSQTFEIKGTQYKWNSTLSPLASVDFSKVVSKWEGHEDAPEDVRANLTKAIDEAHQLGITTRFWDTPGWPRFARDRVNKVLLALGSDWINADDLEAIAREF
ncbi:unnamed protein product [Parajaminaea phylloscopi]